MRSVMGFIVLGVPTCALLGCVDKPSTPDVAPVVRPVPAPVAGPVPQYNVVKTDDVSMGAVRRLRVRVSLPQHYSRDAVEQVAEAVVADITASQPVNAIIMFLYGPGTSTAGVYDVARVEWAPNGRWADAGSVQAGDYSAFAYSVSYNAPAPVPVTTLKPSGKMGLLGVPLPAGATLMERQAGDPAGLRDPYEWYAVSASAADIAGFFNEAMPGAGWLKGGDSTEFVLFFDKGSVMIGVLIESDGGKFRLMGS